MKPTVYAVTEATWRANNQKDLVVARAVLVLADPKKAARQKEGKCLSCYYVRGARASGQAFTEWSCRLCDQPQPMWPNTGTPLLCEDCAYLYRLCCECLADQDLLPRGKIKMVRRRKKKTASAP